MYMHMELMHIMCIKHYDTCSEVNLTHLDVGHLQDLVLHVYY